MSTPPPEVGAKLRHLRRIRGLTLKQIADKVGCSESMLSKIETGKVNPSLTMLRDLVQALDTTIAALFSAEPTTSPVTRAGGRPVIEVDQLRRGPGVVLERIIPYSPDHFLQCNIHIVAPGGGSDGCITHVGEELGYLLEGRLDLTIDGRLWHLGPGDSFCFRSELPHGYHNPGDVPARVLWVNTPPTF